MNASAIACNEHRIITDGATCDALWGVYVASFSDAEERCIQEQICYSRETLGEALADPAYIKFVATVDGEPAGLLLCTNDLEKARVAYVNPRRLRNDYPEYDGRIYYYTAIAVRPDVQGQRIAALLVAGVAAVMDREDALSAFDFSTEKNPKLAEMIVRATEAAQRQCGLRTNKATFTPLGGQMYGVVKLTKE